MSISAGKRIRMDGRREQKKRKDREDGIPSIWRRIFDVMSTVNKVQAIISSIAVFVIMALISSDVVGRFLFHKPVMGTYELGQMFMVCMVFFTLSSRWNRSVGQNLLCSFFATNDWMRALA